MTAPALLAVDSTGIGTIVVVSAVVAFLMITVWNWRLLLRVERVEDDRDDLHKDHEALHTQVGNIVNAMGLHEVKDEQRFKELNDKADDIKGTMTTLVAEVKNVGVSMEKIDETITEHDERNRQQAEATQTELKALSREVSQIQGATGIAPPKKHKRPPKKKKAKSPPK